MPIYPKTPTFSIHRNYPDIIIPAGELDLLSTYKILQSRLGCLRINPHFAKEAVIERFNQIVNGYLNHPSQNRIFDLYLYLFTHTWIFNIEGYPDLAYKIKFDFNYDDQPIDTGDYNDQPIYNQDYIDQPINTEKNMRTLKEVRNKVDQLITKIKYHLLHLD